MLVIAPAVPEGPVRFAAVGGVNTIRLGVLKLARFKRWKLSATPGNRPVSHNSFQGKERRTPVGEGERRSLGVLASGLRRVLRNYCRWAPFRTGPLRGLTMDFRANLFDSRSFVHPARPLNG